MALYRFVSHVIREDGIVTLKEQRLEQLARRNVRQAASVRAAKRAALTILHGGWETKKSERVLREQERDVEAFLQNEAPGPDRAA